MPAIRTTRLRRPRNRRLAAGRAVEAVLFLFVVGSFVYFFVGYAQGSNQFAVRKIAIHGLSYLDEQTVLAQSGITADGNVFAVDEHSIAARVEALPFVERCEVRRVYPDTIALHVHERVPAASLHMGAHAYEIDRNGVVLREYAPTEMPIDPFVTYATTAMSVEIGQPLGVPAVDAALAVWDAFRVSPLYGRLEVSELVALRPDDVRMHCDSVPYEIRWGRGDYGELARRLEGLWAKFHGELPCLEYVDLRFEENVACK
jgi:cell division protein FtsQ